LYTLTVHQEEGYLHAIVTGTNSEDDVRWYVEDIRRECASRRCPRVLVEERLEGPRLGALPVFRLAKEASERARGELEKIAYVDVNAAGDLMKFAENVAVNRGLPVAVFSSVDEARAWIKKKNGSG
jgi:hypothetical protein